ncbi:hypothetical protein MBLNU230_g4879t1 [Neophaeotheca triangularis]
MSSSRLPRNRETINAAILRRAEEPGDYQRTKLSSASWVPRGEQPRRNHASNELFEERSTHRPKPDCQTRLRNEDIHSPSSSPSQQAPRNFGPSGEGPTPTEHERTQSLGALQRGLQEDLSDMQQELAREHAATFRVIQTRADKSEERGLAISDKLSTLVEIAQSQAFVLASVKEDTKEMQGTVAVLQTSMENEKQSAHRATELLGNLVASFGELKEELQNSRRESREQFITLGVRVSALETLMNDSIRSRIEARRAITHGFSTASTQPRNLEEEMPDSAPASPFEYPSVRSEEKAVEDDAINQSDVGGKVANNSNICKLKLMEPWDGY